MQPKSLARQFFRRSQSKLRLMLLPVIFAIVLTILLLWLENYWRLKIITIEGLEKPNSILGLDYLKGSNFFRLSENQTVQLIENLNPGLTVVKLTKIYPNQLRIHLMQTAPLATLILNQGLAVLDSQGKILSKQRSGVGEFEPGNNSITVINFYQKLDYLSLTPGEKIQFEEILTGLFLLEKVRNLGVEVNSIDISGLNMIVFNLKQDKPKENKRKIVFSAQIDEQKQAYQIEILLRQFEVKAEEFRSIDLRFDKPVVKF